MSLKNILDKPVIPPRAYPTSKPKRLQWGAATTIPVSGDETPDTI